MVRRTTGPVQGYQDILFAFAAARPPSPTQQEAFAPLLGVLDSTLIPEVR